MAENDDIDCDGTDEAVCPYCGHVHDCSWEFFDGSNREEIEVDCGRCERPFTLSREFDVTYTSSKKEDGHA